MRPWQHAKSSAGRDGDWLADPPIHEFMDSTKAACPDLPHRMILWDADLVVGSVPILRNEGL